MHSLSLALSLALGAATALRLGAAPQPSPNLLQRSAAQPRATSARMVVADAEPVIKKADEKISPDAPLHVLIAGAGVGGLALANCLEALGRSDITYSVLERTQEFKKFGGPIQLASNAMQGFRAIDSELYDEIEARATWTGNRTNGIKDGVRDEWYAKFDLGTPASVREMPFTCVVDRPDLQEVLMKRTAHSIVNGAAVKTYANEGHGVVATLENGEQVRGDVLIGADGIWSNVRATMNGVEARGPESGVTYSGYTVFAGELSYSGIGADPACGYKVYIGPQQYFVITDIGRGRYQWYAFLAREEGSEATEPKPDGVAPYLANLFKGWSPEALDIIGATKEHEIEQRDLFDRPPSVLKPWTDGNVALLGDAVHAMMPNLGQGGCQALEDAAVIAEKLNAIESRSEIPEALQSYRNRRLARSATVQGLSRFASDIIIRGFDTPCKLGFYDGKFVAENLNYAGVVTRLLQPILPIFFSVQFNFLYAGWANEPLALEPIRDLFLLGPAVLGAGLALDAVIGGEALEAVSTWVGTQSEAASQIITDLSQLF